MLAEWGVRFVILTLQRRAGFGEPTLRCHERCRRRDATPRTDVCGRRERARAGAGRTQTSSSRRCARLSPTRRCPTPRVVSPTTVWGIGTGRTPDRRDTDAHGAIREALGAFRCSGWRSQFSTGVRSGGERTRPPASPEVDGRSWEAPRSDAGRLRRLPRRRSCSLFDF